MKRSIPTLVVIATGLVTGGGISAQTPDGAVDFSQATRPMVAVTDSAEIEFLLFELFLAPAASPDRLHVIDVTRNGFGPDDVVVVYPSGEVFLIPELVPDPVQERMSSWEPEVEYRMDAGNMPASALAGLLAEERSDGKQAENAIMFDLVEAVERSYRDIPMALLFQRDSVGFTFQLWDYNRDAMDYVPRPALATDSTVSRVLTVLEDVGYVPGADVAGLGVTLESVGSGVATVEQALQGVARVPDEDARNLAVRTVLLGSYDFDRSGSIDRAREIDAPPCAVWSALDQAFPGYMRDFGFEDPRRPFIGNVMLNISANVREAAFRRASACASGDQPAPTDPGTIAPPERGTTLPVEVDRFLDTSTAAEVILTVSREGPASATWTRDVRNVLVGRYDLDRSGLLDRASEVRTIPCSVWAAIGATDTESPNSPGTAGGSSVLTADLGFDPALLPAAIALFEPCARSADGTATVRVRDRSTETVPLPAEAIRASVTVPLRGLAEVADEERRYLPAKTVLLAMFDTDRSGGIDRPGELDAMPCSVWSALETTFPDYPDRFGFAGAPGGTPYRGDFVLAISADLRAPADARIRACARGDTPPRATATATEATRADLVVSADVRDFMDLDAAAEVARAAVSTPAGSAIWAASVQAVLVGRYDLDGSGELDRLDELDEVPCVVWMTIEATYGAPLDQLLRGSRGGFVGSEIGIAEAEATYARARVLGCSEG